MVGISELPSSSSPTHDGHRYDVFLSFRGLDTRLNFTAHLHKELVNANISTFLDDEEIETGEDLKQELESAIKASRASIIVLSENYASSTWCLDELVLILDQRGYSSDHIAIPIFYHVEPTNIRKQESSFGIAMEKHKRKMETETDAEKKGKWAEKMELWNKALKEVADLKGKTADGRKETEVIEEIVSDIHRRLGVPLSRTLPDLIGMDYDIEFITLWLKDGSSHTADILTIVGVGGIGKTSLAKYVFGLRCREFPKSNFIADISRRCAGQYNGLLDIQKEICGDISKKSSLQIDDYTSKIENMLYRKKVFLVLDDVDSVNQLDVLLGNKGFHPGSKVIITTKDASLTQSCALFNPIVQPKHIERLLRGLDNFESLQLLSSHAFMSNNPKEGYEEVSKTLAKYCEGHPLALKVLGKSLRNQDVAAWDDCIERLKKEPDSGIQKILQMSFDSLPSDNDKELFKHIACFFVGEDREFTQTILKACGIHTILGIKNLIDRCLLWIGWDKTLMMHQLLQEMGRDLVRQESPKKPWKRSRLWCHAESFKVLKQKKGKGNLLGLALDMRMLEKDKLHYELKTDALSKMDNLMLLQLNYVQLNGSFKKFPEELRWLHMHGFPLEYIPLDSPMENLVALDMSYSNLESFDVPYSNLPRPERQKLTRSCSKVKRLLRSLKILNLSFSEQLRSIGGFSELPALERLILSNCIGLIEVCESIEQCNDLVVIDLSYCIEVRKLPRTMAKLNKVETLILDGCINLSEIPIETRDMDSLEMLNANNIEKSSQTSSLANVTAIPRDLNSLLFFLPSSLVTLSLAKCGLSNESFPIDFNGLSTLKNLNLDDNPIVSLPNCVRSLCKLERLHMVGCSKLKTVVRPPHTLRQLILDIDNSIQEVVFHPEMSPLMFFHLPRISKSSFHLIEGIMKVEAMTHVAKEVLESLGWGTILDFIEQQMEAMGRTREFEVQMCYQFGIFSTIYAGEIIPNWISDRRKGSSISFTMPSSPKKLRGFNVCYVYTMSKPTSLNGYRVPDIRISNVTKNHSWTYRWSGPGDFWYVGNLIFLSHWMFEKKEMEDGDQVTIDIGYFTRELAYSVLLIKECGISVVYEDEDGKMEEDPLAYYKSWNHIIGGDLSPFQKHAGTSRGGEYVLDRRSFQPRNFYHPLHGLQPSRNRFRAFSQRKADIVDVAPENEEVGCSNDANHRTRLRLKNFPTVSQLYLPGESN